MQGRGTEEPAKTLKCESDRDRPYRQGSFVPRYPPESVGSPTVPWGGPSSCVVCYEGGRRRKTIVRSTLAFPLPSVQHAKAVRHSGTDVPRRFPVAAFREDQRIGLAHLFDGGGRDAGGEGPVHRFDEFIGYDCVTGIGRMNAIQREKSAPEIRRQLLAAHLQTVSREIVHQ